MAKNSVRDFDATAANNTDIQSVDIAENCAPSGINNAIRELMADIKDVSAGTVALESPQADSLTVTGEILAGTDTGDAFNAHSKLRVQKADHAYLQIKSANTKQAGVLLGDTDDDFVGGMIYDNSTNHLQFNSGDAERMRLDSSGNVGINETAPTAPLSVKGAQAYASSASNLSTSTTKAAAKINGSSDASTSLFFGSLTNDAEQYIQSANGAGSAADDLALNPFGGNVGVGLVNPDTPLEVQIGSSGNALKLSSSADGASVFLAFEQQESGTKHVRGRIRAASNGVEGGLIFETGASSSTSERMRIDNSGNLLVGTTSGPITSGKGTALAPSSLDRTLIVMTSSSVATGVELIQLRNPNGQVGFIGTNASSTTYQTTSDYRLKENVTGITDGIERVKQLNPSRFNFIADADTTVDGFLAHEVSDIVPEAISGEKDAMKDEEYEVTPAVLDDDGNVVTEAVMGTRTVPSYQGIDHSKLVPLLTAALQEAVAKIETLEAKVTALENA